MNTLLNQNEILMNFFENHWKFTKLNICTSHCENRFSLRNLLLSLCIYCWSLLGSLQILTC